MKLAVSRTSAVMKREREDAILRSFLKLSAASTKLAAVDCTPCSLMAFGNPPFPHFSN